MSALSIDCFSYCLLVQNSGKRQNHFIGRKFTSSNSIESISWNLKQCYCWRSRWPSLYSPHPTPSPVLWQHLKHGNLNGIFYKIEVADLKACPFMIKTFFVVLSEWRTSKPVFSLLLFVQNNLLLKNSSCLKHAAEILFFRLQNFKIILLLILVCKKHLLWNVPP